MRQGDDRRPKTGPKIRQDHGESFLWRELFPGKSLHTEQSTTSNLQRRLVGRLREGDLYLGHNVRDILTLFKCDSGVSNTQHPTSHNFDGLRGDDPGNDQLDVVGELFMGYGQNQLDKFGVESLTHCSP